MFLSTAFWMSLQFLLIYILKGKWFVKDGLLIEISLSYFNFIRVRTQRPKKGILSSKANIVPTTHVIENHGKTP